MGSTGDLRRVWGLFPDGRRLFVLAVFTAAIESLLFLPIGLVIGRVFDRYIPDGDERAIAIAGGVILILYLAGAATSLLARRIAVRESRDAVAALRSKVIAHVYARPRAWHDRRDTGTLHSQIVNDTDRIEFMLDRLANPALPAAIVIVALAVAALVIAPLAFAALVVTVPVMVVVAQRFARRARLLGVRWRESFSRFSRGVNWGLRNVTLMKSEAAEDWDVGRRRDEIEELAARGRELGMARAKHAAVQGAIAAPAAVVVLVVGGIAVAHDTISLGDLIAFYAFVGLILRQLAELAPALDGLTLGVVSLARLEELLADDTSDPYRGTRRLDYRGEIALEGVSFGYDAERTVVSGLDLRIECGERVALIGPSGAGKSTVVSLIAGLYRPFAGRLTADGVPYDELDLGHLRRSIGIAPQDPIVFTGTVLENIAYGRGATSSEEAMRAARSAAASFIDALPDGLGTEVGDEGVRLSGGQRQRLAIARALVHEPRLLVLDEPSTYLDQGTIAELMGNLAGLPQKPAIMVVTHDPEVADRMDRVIRLRDGKLERTGAGS